MLKVLPAFSVFLIPLLFTVAGFSQSRIQSVAGEAVSASSDTVPRAANKPQVGGLSVVPDDFASLKLQPGFLLGVNVLDEPDLSGSFRIDENGNLPLPILGDVHVKGMTVSDLREALGLILLRDQIMKDPQVTVTVIQYVPPQITLVGEIISPGQYPLLAPRRLTDVLALGGGTTVAAGKEIDIVHAGAAYPAIRVHYSRDGSPSLRNNPLVLPGDTVEVGRAGIVYVLGAVNRPGGYVMQESGTLNVLQAIAMASGTTLAAKTGDLHVLRRMPQGSVSDTKISYKKLSQGKVPEIQLQAQDIIYVPLNKLKAVLGTGSTIFSAAASASIYAVALH